jgi:hypothetical protein
MNDTERVLRAQEIWHREKGKAAALIITGWFSKVGFRFPLRVHIECLR